MKLLKDKSVKIGEKEYPIRMSVRSMINFEELAGHSIATINTLSDISILFYCTVVAAGEKLTYEQFMDMIDVSDNCLS